MLALASSGPVSQHAVRGVGGGGRVDILALCLLIEIARRDEGKRVCRDERKPLLPDFKVYGHLMMSQDSTMPENRHVFFVHNF